ncbi:DUF2624 domain-containing protein [Cytobacillus purgationiresistens]|uniref:DUF2624 domain-containing protein n=1 Tax=Cytobacillus purgationiresistens TaxID=863449 RepID=A0ABU0ADZ2_9BACI|nr:DUF2624 domain-containing protein [Cytobacillus purgationiresistens]MDQ0269471.1 hypothetical protein [Cytobacillus purgationiresistens]
MNIFENIINHKVSNITADELLKYAKQFNISVKKAEAEQIAQYLRGKKVNIFNDSERTKLIKEIAKVAGADTAKSVNKLFLMFTK